MNSEAFASRTKLSDTAVRLLEKTKDMLDTFCELAHCPIFIDLLEDQTGIAYVYAEAHPRDSLSLYSRAVAGSYAFIENEPAVYRAFDTGFAVRDTKALTQEARVVLQNVLPLKDETGVTFAVLILERDITRDLQREEKMLSMASVIKHENVLARTTGDETLRCRESLHRVKNHLQLLISLARMRARHATSPEATILLHEYADSLLTVATLYDTINGTINRDEIEIVHFLTVLSKRLTSVLEGMAEITVTGSTLMVNSEKARILGIIVNELIHNSLQHGKRNDQILHIVIDVNRGNRYHTLTVEDDGSGLMGRQLEKGLGLSIIDSMLAEAQDDAMEMFDTGTGMKAVLHFKS